MESDDRLDALFGALRQPATPAERAGESATVASMTAAVAPPTGTSPLRAPSAATTSGRRLRVASFVAAGVIGFGGVAAAGPSIVDTVTGNDSPVLVIEENPVETTTTTTIASTIPDAPDEGLVPAIGETDALATSESDEPDDAGLGDDTPAELVDDPATLFDETTCAEGSHGKTVSSVAKETPSGPGKGQIVSTAAHSSCGKKDKADKHDEADENDEADEADKAEAKADKQADKAEAKADKQADKAEAKADKQADKAEAKADKAGGSKGKKDKDD